MGAKVVYAGPINGMLIGEGDWDMVAIVQYPNRPTMASLDSREDYAAIHYPGSSAFDRYNTTHLSQRQLRSPPKIPDM